MPTCKRTALVATTLAALFALACSDKSSTPDGASSSTPKAEAAQELTVYSGRKEALVGSLLQDFEKKHNVKLKVRYGKTAELTALLLEEGKASPAALFLAQDAGALGALEQKGALQKLDDDVLNLVPAMYRSPKGTWVGVTGRARTLVYNTAKMKAEDVPSSVFDLTDPKWKGRLGWAPSNGSFQAFVTGMRVLVGEEKTQAWLEGVKKNEPKVYPKNTPIVRAAADGDIDVGLVNHYYLYRFLKDDPKFPAKNAYTKAGDPGSLVNVSGVGILASAQPAQQKLAKELAQFMLGKDAQAHFAKNTFEYPLVDGVQGPAGLPALKDRQPPKLDLASLHDLQGTLKLLQKVGALP